MNARVSPEVVKVACPHDCPDTCAMLVTVENGVATKIQGDPSMPFTDGTLCTKVARPFAGNHLRRLRRRARLRVGSIAAELDRDRPGSSHHRRPREARRISRLRPLHRADGGS